MPLIPAFRRERKVEVCELQASLVYIGRHWKSKQARREGGKENRPQAGRLKRWPSAEECTQF